jgi:hypothetical protein
VVIPNQALQKNRCPAGSTTHVHHRILDPGFWKITIHFRQYICSVAATHSIDYFLFTIDYWDCSPPTVCGDKDCYACCPIEVEDKLSREQASRVASGLLQGTVISVSIDKEKNSPKIL